MSFLDESRRVTPTEKRSAKQYYRELVGASLLYMALVLGSVHNVDRFSGAERFLVALLPMVGAAAMVVAIVRFVMRTDELQRRTLVDAAAIALVVTAVVTLTLGFLENAGVPRVDAGFVWPIAVGTWAVVLPFVRRRYQ